MHGPRATLTSARRRRGGRGIQFTHCPAVQRSRTPARAELGRIKEEAERSSPPQSLRKVAVGSPSMSLRPARSRVPHRGYPGAGSNVAAFESSLDTLPPRRVSSWGRQELGKTRPPLLRGRATQLRGSWPPGAARRKLCAAMRAAPGTCPRCSRTAPPRAALPAAACGKASEERPRRAARGALLLLSRARPSPG